jgi:hypothetical protein
MTSADVWTWSLPGALTACVVAIGGALAWRRRRASAELGTKRCREADELREVLEAQRVACAEQLAALSKNLELPEASIPRSNEGPWDGRLNVSVRAQALQLLRAGVSPDTAAATLGVPSHDIRLLARVSRMLAAR